MIQIIRLGEWPVYYGSEGDRARIRNLVGSFKHWLDDGLDPHRFAPLETDPNPWRHRAGIAGWPEGDSGSPVELFAVNFKIEFSCYGAMLRAAREEERSLGDLKPGGLPHLATQCSLAQTAVLFHRYHVTRLEAPNPNSLWRSGGLCVPTLRCDPRYPGLEAHFIGKKRRVNVSFLYLREQ